MVRVRVRVRVRARVRVRVRARIMVRGGVGLALDVGLLHLGQGEAVEHRRLAGDQGGRGVGLLSPPECVVEEGLAAPGEGQGWGWGSGWDEG